MSESVPACPDCKTAIAVVEHPALNVFVCGLCGEFFEEDEGIAFLRGGTDRPSGSATPEPTTLEESTSVGPNQLRPVSWPKL